jgi:endonuclease III
MNYSFYIEEIRKTLSHNRIDFKKIIHELGQVDASEKREIRKSFLFNDHLRGFILALLSKQRPWGPIAQNLNRIEEIFQGYDYSYILKTNGKIFTDKIKSIQCGNRSIKSQMDSLKINIETFLKIQDQYGSLDLFVESDKPEIIAELISDSGSKFKLKELGFTLALEYLKNVGIKAIKPDVHVRRLIGAERLGWVDNEPSELETVLLLHKVSKEINVNETYIDNLLWLFCATNYGNICGAIPKCDKCSLRSFCNFQKITKS